MLSVLISNALVMIQRSEAMLSKLIDVLLSVSSIVERRTSFACATWRHGILGSFIERNILCSMSFKVSNLLATLRISSSVTSPSSGL